MPAANPCTLRPHWLNQPEVDSYPTTLDWLFDQGSLTQRLSALAHGDFSIEPLAQGWQPLRDDECSALDVPPGSVGWVREVYLCGHRQHWVFARSVVTKAALDNSDFSLEQLGSRSLGEVLFQDPAFARRPIQACHYPVEWLPPGLTRADLWVRRSRFDRGELAVLVAEVFLPDLWRATHP
ncbi:chorismate--pyruvate lyase family protein [Pseudomonas sp. nanlin1]|uniref:chorismate--pyruvate lyase family protein n=1 Tax=Pseudomonas sp. nanlin1 TaxID=3040605 RepID=UPI00388FF17A